MRMTEIDYDAQPPIDGYAPSGFRVGGEWHSGGLLLLPSGRSELAEISVSSLSGLIAGAEALDVLLIGQGSDIAPLVPDLRDALETAGLGYEVMATPSACRTYNVLLTEDRRVGIAALTISPQNAAQGAETPGNG